jgi:Predicted O-methyltransferase
MKKEAELILEEIEKIAKENKLPIIGKNKGKIIVDFLNKHKSKKLLEIGTLIGYSAIFIASYTKAKVTTIEINEEIAKIALKNIKNAGLENKIKVIIGDALDVIPKLNDIFDSMFIDAEKSQYLKYLILAEPKLKNNSIIIADNVKKFENEMKDFLNYVRNNKLYKSITIEVDDDALEIIIKKF